MSEATSFPDKRKSKKNPDLESKDLKSKNPESKDPESKNLKSKDLKSRESCWNIMNFFKLLEEMETNKIPEKLGKSTCDGPVSSKIEYSYRIKINDPGRKEKMPKKPVF